MKSSFPNSNMIDLKKLHNSLENLVDNDDDDDVQVDEDDDMNGGPLITYPDDTPVHSELSSPTNLIDTVKFEQKRTNNIKRTKVSTYILFLLLINIYLLANIQTEKFYNNLTRIFIIICCCR